MTEQEAIECLKCYRAQSGTSFPEEIEMAINALEEIEQYRAIGTLEECRAAMEKQTAKKPITYEGTNRADCPACGATIRGISKPFGDWCSHCGQRLDWSDEA